MKKNNNTKRNWIIALVIIIALIIVIRLLLPVFILNYANKQLEENPDYEGKINGITLSILKGNYSLTNITIDEVDSPIKEPMLTLDEIWFSFDYNSLLKGKIVGRVELVRPVLNIVAKPEAEPKMTPEDIAQSINELMPVRIEILKITDGIIRYFDFSTEPNINVQAYNIKIEATNLTTVPQKDKLLPAKVIGFANTTGQGVLNFHMNLDPFNSVPTFDINLDLRGVQLPELNHFLRSYANLDVEKGSFGLHTEIASNNGYFKGYVKPLIQDLEVAPFEAEDKGLLQKLYEAGVAVTTDILESPEINKDQIGTRIPLEGELEDPNVRVWTAVINLLRNAFIQALIPSIDHSINIGDVKEGIQKEN
ncbi:MAG: DUF748 domain-containing protein [Bacteroidota bacterium]|nr:DUF748 domain-containing protein [Bacteroidota bacterium]